MNKKQDLYPPVKNSNVFVRHKITATGSPDIKNQTNHWSEWCEVTAWNCVINVSNAKSTWRKVAWAIFIIFFGILSFYQTGTMIRDYIIDKEWITSVSYEMDDDGIDWPNITICDLNQYRKSVARSANLTDPYHIAYVSSQYSTDAILFYKKYQSLLNDSIGNDTTFVQDTVNGYWELMSEVIGQASLDEIYSRIEKKCSDTVIHCGFSDAFLLHEKNYSCCDEENVQYLRQSFAINPTKIYGKSRIILNSGDTPGVYFLLNPNISDYYESLTMKQKPSAGLRLQLYYGAPDDYTTPSTILLTPGTNVLVSLTPEIHRTVASDAQIGPFYYESAKPCLETYRYNYIDTNMYSQQLCIKDCMITYEIHENGCTTRQFIDQTVNINLTCTGTQVFQIMNSKHKNDFNFTYSDGFKTYDCFSKCQEACEYRLLDTKTTQAMFPAPPLVKAFVTYLNRVFDEKNYTEEDANQMILFEMYYPTNEKRVITKSEKISLDQFISNVGGALSLWTGLSILSMFEIVVFFCDWIVTKAKHYIT